MLPVLRKITFVSVCIKKLSKYFKKLIEKLKIEVYDR